MACHNVKIKDGKINFACKMNNCKHTCCGPFCGISQEISSVDQRPFDEIVLTDKDYETLCKNGYSHLVEDGVSSVNGKTYHKMALEPDGTCKAFVDGKCQIHEFNPTLCRAFPFYFDLFAGLCCITCEGFSEDNWVELEKCAPFIEAAKEMYRFWLDFYSE